jgi:hypothetical protein
MTKKQFKITLTCETKERGSGTHAVVGVFLSEAWWRVLTYWLGNRLGGEGLLVTNLTHEEITSSSKE